MRVQGTVSKRLQVSASSSAVAMKDNALICEVRGPTSPKMQLTLKKENQVDRVTKEKVSRVSAPEAGQWECLLNEGNKVKMSSNIQGKDSIPKAHAKPRSLQLWNLPRD